MTELPWATPAAIGALTIPQLVCLMHKHPPGAAPIATAEDFRAMADEYLRAESDWRGG